MAAALQSYMESGGAHQAAAPPEAALTAAYSQGLAVRPVKTSATLTGLQLCQCTGATPGVPQQPLPWPTEATGRCPWLRRFFQPPSLGPPGLALKAIDLRGLHPQGRTPQLGQPQNSTHNPEVCPASGRPESPHCRHAAVVQQSSWSAGLGICCDGGYVPT